MDLTPTESQQDAASLAATVFAKECTPERLRAVDATDDRFDPETWRRVADAGLVGLALSERYAGGGVGLLELCSVLVEAGRRLAPVPLATHVPAAMAIAEHGTEDQWAAWLGGAATGQLVLAPALAEELDHAPARPATTAERDGDRWRLRGAKVAVPTGTRADLFLVPASAPEGVAVFLVRADDPGVTVQPQRVSDGDLLARLELDGTAVPDDHRLGGSAGADGDHVVEWLRQRLVVAQCALQLGTVRGALDLTAAYARSREQFGRPIGSFQAVSQRLADAYIDVLGVELTLWQAAWRLAEGLPATREVAIAKVWAADAGHRVAHTTVHVHGGVGIDLDGEAHRYFTRAKLNELALGGATDQAREVGRLLAADPA